MSNEIMISGGKLPAFLMKAISQVSSDSLLVSAGPSFPRISLKNNRFTVNINDEAKVLGDAAKGTLDVVILAATPNSRHRGKQFYASEYDGSKDDAAPTCWSSNGVAPDATVTAKQCDNCATCPKNAWGSAVSKKSGKLIKACRDIKTLYVVSPKISGPILMLNVPTMSLKNLASYGQQLAAYMPPSGEKLSIPVYAVITTLAFNMDTKNSIELGFRFGGMLSEEQFVKVCERLVSDEMKEVLEAGSEPTGKAAAAPTAATAPAAELEDGWDESQTAPAPDAAPKVAEKPKAAKAPRRAAEAQPSVFQDEGAPVAADEAELLAKINADLNADGWD